jgi:hypothetical protein
VLPLLPLHHWFQIDSSCTKPCKKVQLFFALFLVKLLMQGQAVRVSSSNHIMPTFGHSLMQGETFKMSSSRHISTTFGQSSMQGHSFKFNTFNHARNTSSQSSMQNQRFNHQSTRPMETVSSPSSMPCPQRVMKSTRQGTPNLQQSLGWFVTFVYVGQIPIVEVEI